MINGTWLLLLLGSFTSAQCFLPCGPSIIALSVAVWTHSTNQDSANNSGVLLMGQLFNQVRIHCDKEENISSGVHDL